MLTKRWYVFLAIFVVAGGIVFQQVQNKNNSKKELTYKVKREDLRETLSLSGKVDADQKATLRFQTSGRLAWVGVKEGDHVNKFQGIASLDQRDVKKNLEKKLNTYLKSRQDFDQTQDDYKYADLTDKVKRIISKNQEDLNGAVLDVELQQLTVEYSYLYSPIEGIVTRVASPYGGVNATPTQAEFEIVNPATVYFSALADQTEVAKFHEGKTGDIVFDSYPDEKVYGTIRSIAFTPKEGETGTVYEVKVSLNGDNSNYHWRLGMTGDVSFILQEKLNVLSIPTSFIKTEKGKKYVLKKNNDNEEKIFIEVGLEIDDKTQITSGLKEGDMIYD